MSGISNFSSSGRLFCDGEDVSPVEYVIQVLSEGPGRYARGTMWADIDALTTAMLASSVQISSDEREGKIAVEVKEVKGDGSAIFAISGKHSF
ncbi:hypothetical protein [Brucella sp. IR073]|uniref:hypothetical protein n=1 Tax=unclassified Brucella TaxID=2632610 RepID=UPI003B9872A5